ncbi:glycosyltransferase [uncultured Flavobacterium sp.]|uniref:glycosyltransferase n=1 Tax=uncultured Flavobacterium sp. TaxID=165435 RepID=UPI0030ED6863
MIISVAICTFNGEKYLGQQLDSILSQSTPVDQIVICDDKSTDKTKLILEKYKTKYPEIINIFKNKNQLRSNKNFEKALSLCTGDYIFFADQDDIWQPDKVSKTIAFFLENTKIQGVFSNADLINEDNSLFSNEITLWDCSGFFQSEFIEPINLIMFMIIEGNFVTGATLCIKKDVKQLCLPFQTNEKNFYHDHWIAFLLAEKNTLGYINENLVSYRIHINQQIGIGNHAERIKSFNNYTKAYKMILGFFKPTNFNEYKLITRFFYDKYIHHKNNYNKDYSQIINYKIEVNLLKLFKKAKINMIKAYPLKYITKKIAYLFKKDNSLTFK